MAAATVDPSIPRNIMDSPLKIPASHPAVPNTPEGLNSTAGCSQSPCSQSTPQTSSQASMPNTQETGTTVTPKPGSQKSQRSPEPAGEDAADSDSDDEPLPPSAPASCPRARRRLAVASDDSDEEGTPAAGGSLGNDATGSEDEAETDAASKSAKRSRVRRPVLDSDDDDEDDDDDGKNTDVKDSNKSGDGVETKEDKSGSEGEDEDGGAPTPPRPRVRRLKVASDDDSETEEPSRSAAEKRGERGSEEQDEQKRKEKNMRRLMALGDSSSDEDVPIRERPPSRDPEEDREHKSSPGDKKKRKKTEKGAGVRREKEAAEQMRQIRSAAQRRTRESRLNLPYHRPRQRTLHEFLARRQRAPVLPDDLRLSRLDEATISRRLEEKEKEIEQFYRAPSDQEEDGGGSDPEWTPGAAPATSQTPAAPAAPASGAGSDQAPGAAAGPSGAPAEDEGDGEDAAVVSQSSQKVQEWLEQVEKAEDADIVELIEKPGGEMFGCDSYAAGMKAGTEEETIRKMDTEEIAQEGELSKTKKIETEQAADVEMDEVKEGVKPVPEGGRNEEKENADETAELSEAVKSAEVGDSPESAPRAGDDLRRLSSAEEARSVSADTETTSLAPGDSASQVNARVSAAGAASPSVATPPTVATSPTASATATASPAAAAASPAAAAAAVTDAAATAATAAPAAGAAPRRLAALAARLPGLGDVLKATPRLQKRSEVVSLDSDEESDASEPTELDKFVERFVRHSAAKPKTKEKKTVNIGLVRFESDAAGGQRLVSDSVTVTVAAGGDGAAPDGPPGAQRQHLQKILLQSIRAQREHARQRREREYKMYNTEEVDDGYLDDLPDEEAELDDVSSESGESEPEPEPPIVDKPRARCSLVDDEADEDDERQEEEEEQEEGKEESDELKLVLEDDEDEADDQAAERGLGSPHRASVITEPELFFTQPSGLHNGDAASQISQDSQLTDSMVTAHQPGGGFKFGGTKPPQESQEEPESEETPDTQIISHTPVTVVPLPVEETQQLLSAPTGCAAAGLSPLGPLRLTPEPEVRDPRQRAGPRSAIGALLDPAMDESIDDIMSLCSGKFDAPGTGTVMSRVARADTQPATDLLSVPPPTNRDGVVTWSASQKLQNRPNSTERMSLLSAVDMFEDGNANMPLEVVSSDDDERSTTPQLKQRSVRKRRRKLVFSDDEGSDGEDRLDEDNSADEDMEASDEDSLMGARAEDSSLPTNFTGFFGQDQKKVRAEFFDAEAELSGSDEPSEDEADGDELDDMDEEEADKEDIDEDKLREQVERIHQKAALDEDLREMKLFQERFLEDGDLHGKGRERKFRWSNADEAGEDSTERRGSDEEADPAEEERDEKWRLERHEREKWLQENAQKERDEEPEPEKFTFLRPGQKAVRRLLSATNRAESRPAAPAPAPALPASPKAPKISRGSFLHRGKEALARLVSTARSLSLPAGTSSKNSSNRTFSVGKRPAESEPDPDVELEFRQAVEEKTKRKAPPAAPVDAKRAKLSRSFSSLNEDSQSNSLFSVIL